MRTFSGLSLRVCGLWVALYTCPAHSEFGVGLIAESAAIYESNNKARIPGSSGTLIDLTESDKKSPSLGYRIYASYQLAHKHQLRILWAPLTIKGQLPSTGALDFAGQSFVAGNAISTLYKFNSYRLTYAYSFDEFYDWSFTLGATLKIRDAEIRLSRDNQVGSKKNIGLVPLLHWQSKRRVTENWAFNIDFDGLVAPQGRAFDLALVVERFVTLFGAGHALYVYGGYRTVEGGAENDEVYNFAWFQSAVLGLRGAF